MEAALVCYTLLNLAILGFILLFVRASRARAVPNERRDLEENSLVTADWEWVRRERCLPSGCPRLRGQPRVCGRALRAAILIRRAAEPIRGLRN